MEVRVGDDIVPATTKDPMQQSTGRWYAVLERKGPAGNSRE